MKNYNLGSYYGNIYYISSAQQKKEKDSRLLREDEFSRRA
jgi:hypothetical protein